MKSPSAFDSNIALSEGLVANLLVTELFGEFVSPAIKMLE